MTDDLLPGASLPSRGPSKPELAERDRYAKLTESSAQNVRSSAQAWRTGLAAFVTLVTTGVVIKGRDTTAGLSAGWRASVTVLVAGGLLLAVVGLWQALAAEAGTDSGKQTLQSIRRDHGTLDAYQVYLAAQAARRLQWGRRAIAVAVVLLLAGIAVAWWAPDAAGPPGYVLVFRGQASICGTLRPGPAGQLSLSIPGRQTPVAIPLSQVSQLLPASDCP